MQTESDRLASVERRLLFAENKEYPQWITYGAACGLVAYAVLIILLAKGKVELF